MTPTASNGIQALFRHQAKKEETLESRSGFDTNEKAERLKTGKDPVSIRIQVKKAFQAPIPHGRRAHPLSPVLSSTPGKTVVQFHKFGSNKRTAKRPPLQGQICTQIPLLQAIA